MQDFRSFSFPGEILRVSERKKQHARFAEIINADKAGRYITALSHESSTFPTSITKDGEMFHANKADLVDCIVTKAQESRKASQYNMYYSRWCHL